MVTLSDTVGELASPEVADFATNGLYHRDPIRSAKVVFTRSHQIFGVACLALLVGFAVWRPLGVLNFILLMFSFAFLVGTAFKYYVSVKGARYDVVEKISAAQVAALNDADLPRYTVLVPVFREANIVGQLVRNLGDIDYPKDKLEVLILTEQEDQETRDAIAKSSPPDNFRVIIVPKGYPQTKPRACNVGLQLATGDYVVIYDAEDRPDPDQLKKALVAFSEGGDKTAVVQAALNYFNYRENFLTRMFTLEYSYWFDYMLPGLDHSSLPIPLGGTSNHFRTDILKELGGWDPFNVTEDADLGIRASALGYEVTVINSTTMEEANTSMPNFIRQRSRWIKGYMQTTLVHAREPFALVRRVGLRKFLGFAALIGGTPITFLAVIPFLLLTLISVIFGAGVLSQVFTSWVLWLSIFNFVIGNQLVVYLCLMAPYKRSNFSLIGWALLNPLYWVLHSIAAYKALWQLLVKPHYWEKTLHGLTAEGHAS